MIDKLTSVVLWSVVITAVYTTVLTRIIKNNLTREENVGKSENFKARII